MVTCVNCGCLSTWDEEVTTQIFLTVKPAHLNALLSDVVASVVVDADCNWCDSKRKEQLQLIIVEPSVLVILCTRFLDMRTKNSSGITFDGDVEFGDYFYSLKGVLVHHGDTLNTGHYTSYFKCSIGSKEYWYHFNDSVVTEIADPREVLDSPQVNEGAYILVYEMSFSKLKPIVPDSAEDIFKGSCVDSPVVAEPNSADEDDVEPCLSDNENWVSYSCEKLKILSLEGDHQHSDSKIHENNNIPVDHRNILVESVKKQLTWGGDSKVQSEHVKLLCCLVNKMCGSFPERGLVEHYIKNHSLEDVSNIITKLQLKRSLAEDIGVQVSSPLSSYELCSRNEDFKFWTGLSIEQFEALYKFLGSDTICSKLKYRYDDNTPVKQWEVKKVSLKSRLFLLLLRLRRGLPLEEIAKVMGISPSHAGAIFFTWLRFVAKSFKVIQKEMAVTAEMQNKDKPSCFRPFKNLRMIIDSTEFPTERPSNLQEQGNMFSKYKGTQTAKVLIGMSCYGGISFISPAFQGSISDKELLRQSGLLDLLHRGDALMADRGFRFDEELEERGVNLLKPPHFHRRKKKLSAMEEAYTKAIAMVRIYVEHVIGKLKFWNILNRRIQIQLLPLISDIVYVIGCLYNFSEPYIGLKKRKKKT